jgi:hypothetical protein
MPAFDVARRWTGRVMLDRAGAKIGTIVDIYYDAEADEPGSTRTTRSRWRTRRTPPSPVAAAGATRGSEAEPVGGRDPGPRPGF